MAMAISTAISIEDVNTHAKHVAYSRHTVILTLPMLFKLIYLH